MFRSLSRVFLLPLALAAATSAAAADVDLTVGVTSSQTLTYAWTVVPPSGGTAPTITPNQTLPSPTGGVTNRAKATFLSTARNGIYVFTLTATDTSGRKVTDTTSVTVNAAQTITFPTISTHTVGDAPFAAGATSSKSLALSYATSAPGVATVNSSGLFTIIGAGSVTITASNTGDAVNFIAPASASVTFTVNPAPVTPTLTLSPTGNLTRTMGDAPFTLVATTSSTQTVTFQSDTPGVATVSPAGLITLVGPGTAQITVAVPAGGGFAAKSVTITLTVLPAAPVITLRVQATPSTLTLP